MLPFQSILWNIMTYKYYEITNEDIDQLVRFIMDGIRKHT